MKPFKKLAFALSALLALPFGVKAMEWGTWMDGSTLEDATDSAVQRLQWICSESGRNLVPGSTRIDKVQYSSDQVGNASVLLYMTGRCE